MVLGIDCLMDLRVANVLLDARFGGPQNLTLQIAAWLKQYGVETVVIIPQDDSDYFYSLLIEQQVAVKRLPLHRLTTHKPHLLGWFLFFVPEVLSLRRFLTQERINLVHCNSSTQIKDVLAAKLAGAKVIWHLHDTGTPLPVKALFNVLAPLADGFILAGHRAHKYYLDRKRLSAKKRVVIQSPVDSRKFDPQKVIANKQIGRKDGLKITTVAIISPSKGLEHFIEMAGVLNRKYNDLSFHIVGQPLQNYMDYFQTLERMVRDYKVENVFFYGSSDDVASVLKATDIFVCPSNIEASPTVVWEAMMMEKPVVSTDVGDVALYIKNGENGFVVPTRDAAALAEKVGVLIEDQGLRARFGSLAREVSLREFDIGITTYKHQKFYREIMNGR